MSESRYRSILESGVQENEQKDNGKLKSFSEQKDTATRIPIIHIILFLATVVTTLITGSQMVGGNPFDNFSDIIMGVPFSFSFLLILGCHEFGHYYYARKYNVDATLPYFLPAPPFFPIIGTFGAFIRIKSPIYRKRVLLHIGAAGPIAGFVVSVFMILLGYMIIPNQEYVTQQILGAHHGINLDESSSQSMQLVMGNSILFSAMASLFNVIVPMNEIYHFPLIFSGWVGFLVTMLNLLPLGQLDGGHIAYATLGEKQNRYSKWVFLSLIPLGFLSANWWFWAVLILVLMRTWKHPPIMDIDMTLTKNDKYIALACLFIFITCFMPVPVYVLQ